MGPRARQGDDQRFVSVGRTLGGVAFGWLSGRNDDVKTSKAPEQAAKSGPYKVLPARVELSDTVEVVETETVPDPFAGQDTVTARVLQWC